MKWIHIWMTESLCCTAEIGTIGSVASLQHWDTGLILSLAEWFRGLELPQLQLRSDLWPGIHMLQVAHKKKKCKKKKEIKWNDTGTPMFTAALFTIAKTCKPWFLQIFFKLHILSSVPSTLVTQMLYLFLLCQVSKFTISVSLHCSNWVTAIDPFEVYSFFALSFFHSAI